MTSKCKIIKYKLNANDFVRLKNIDILVNVYIQKKSFTCAI